MDKLFPIIRRVRRPLLPPDAVLPEVAAHAAEPKKAEEAERTRTAKEKHARTPTASK